MAGYTRQSIADIVSGADILAAPLNNEFNQLQNAFHATTGHVHDGSAGNGPKLSLTAAVSGILPVANGGTNAATIEEARTSLFGISTTVDNTIPRFDGLTGAIQTSALVISDTNVLSGVTGIQITTVGNSSIEMGRIDGVASTPFIDFHSGATATDYDVRVIASGGSGSIAGGTLSIYAATVDLDAAVSANSLTVDGTLTSGAITGTTATFSGAVTATGLTLSTGPLDVPSGGTGLNTLTANKVLVGNGSADVLVTKTAPNGDFVGTTDVQTLTNKNIDAVQLSGTVSSGNISGSYTGITGVGALAAGSISSGFGSINIGTDPITAGIATFSGAVTSSQNFIGNATFVVLATSASGGTVILRPNGAASSTAQATLSDGGTFAAGTFSGSGAGLTAIPQAAVTGLVTALADKTDNDISILAGTAMTGGGTLAASRTLSVDSTVWRDANLPTVAQINGILAGAGAGTVGSYGFFRNESGSTETAGSTIAGSSLRYASSGGDASGTPSGSWRCMGYAPPTGDESETTLFNRYA